MDWSSCPVPAMRLETRFGDRVLPVFVERPKNLWAMVLEAASANPSGEALVCGEVRMTWRQVIDRSARLAAGLRKLGLQRGDRVALLLGNRIEFPLLLFAAAQAGLITVLLGTRQQTPEIAYVLGDCGAKLLIHEAALAERVPHQNNVPELEHRIIIDDGQGHSDFRVLSENAPLGEDVDVGEEDTAIILYTSGTTGRPKGAMLAHCNIVHSATIFVSCLGLTATDRSIAAVPLAHVTGVVANIMTMVRCAGSLIIMAEFKAAEYLKVAAAERVTYTVMVPAMYNLCLMQPDFDSYDLSSWRIGGFGGAPMPIAAIEKLAIKLPGLKLINCYGATETTSPSTIMPGDLTARHIDSVGLPCPGATIVVMDEEGHEMPRGTVGEIWIASASVIKGYWNNPKATTETFTGGFWHSDRRRQLCARIRSSERHDQSRRLENLLRRGRIRACRPSCCRRERHRRETMPRVGRARSCRHCHQRTGQYRHVARLVRGAAFRLQGAGKHRAHDGPATAQCEWQGA
jgi:long-chain acyl-CoA synthetase